MYTSITCRHFNSSELFSGVKLVWFPFKLAISLLNYMSVSKSDPMAIGMLACELWTAKDASNQYPWDCNIYQKNFSTLLVC